MVFRSFRRGYQGRSTLSVRRTLAPRRPAQHQAVQNQGRRVASPAPRPAAGRRGRSTAPMCQPRRKLPGPVGAPWQGRVHGSPAALCWTGDLLDRRPCAPASGWQVRPWRALPGNGSQAIALRLRARELHGGRRLRRHREQPLPAGRRPRGCRRRRGGREWQSESGSEAAKKPRNCLAGPWSSDCYAPSLRRSA